MMQWRSPGHCKCGMNVKNSSNNYSYYNYAILVKQNATLLFIKYVTKMFFFKIQCYLESILLIWYYIS